MLDLLDNIIFIFFSFPHLEGGVCLFKYFEYDIEIMM